MATKRMLSTKIVDSDAFMEMPIGSQALYFHLCMRADDEGFVGNPKRIVRMLNVGEDDFKILLMKRFLLSFPSGVVVVKHWLIHNTIRMDRFSSTTYQQEKNSLSLNEYKAYTDRHQIGDKPVPQSNLIKYNLINNIPAKADKNSKKTKEKKEAQFTTLGADVLKAFEAVDPKNKTYYANKTQRKACDFLITEYTFEKVIDVVAVLPALNKEKLYIAQITSPWELQQNWVKLMNIIHQKKGEINKGKNSVAFG